MVRTRGKDKDGLGRQGTRMQEEGGATMTWEEEGQGRMRTRTRDNDEGGWGTTRKQEEGGYGTTRGGMMTREDKGP